MANVPIGGIMIGYAGSIESATLNNPFFRQMRFTGKHSQLVVMCLQPGEEIGEEVHDEYTSSTFPLRLYTIYSPPNHPDGTVHRTSAEAMAAENAHGL